MTLQGADISHWNDFNLPEIIKNYSFVFLKVSSGAAGYDPTYLNRLTLLKSTTVKIGGYAFLTGDNSIHQANNFFLQARLDGSILPVIDVESNSIDLANSCTLTTVYNYIVYFNKITNMYPILYTNSSTLGRLWTDSKNRYGKKVADLQLTYLTQCKLWDVSSHNPPVIPSQWNNKWTFDQTGIVNKIDQDIFNGTLEELNKLWSINCPKVDKLEVTVNTPGSNLNLHSKAEYLKKTGKALNNGVKVIVDLTQQTDQVWGFNTYHWIKLYNQDLFVDKEYLC